MTRFYAEEHCEHGQFGSHWRDGPFSTLCPGGPCLELTDIEAVEWCEVHKANRNIRTAFDEAACDRWWLTVERGGDGSPCRIVSVAIIPLPPEADE